MLAQGAWYLPQTADAFLARNALAGLWTGTTNYTKLPASLHRTCLPVMLLSQFIARARLPQLWRERAFYTMFPLWKRWLAAQQLPECEVIHGINGYCEEIFQRPEAKRKLKVIDFPNSHAVTFYGFWQRECDLWCPGERVPIPHWMFARWARELELADAVLVLSKFCKESMLLNGVPEEKIIVNPFGTNQAVFTKRSKLPEKPRFIAVGTICVRKGHQYLFRAWQIVKQACPEAELICVGDVKSDFRMEWPKWRGSFTHIPFLSQQEIGKLLGECTAFVFPSQEEGFPRAQIEAMACGLPIIGTHEGGATTLVDDGIEGLIVPSRDPQKIADAMLKLAQDPALAAQMGEASFRRGGANNTWQDYGDRLLQAYAERLEKLK